MPLYISILWQWPDDVAVTFYMFMFLQIIINSHDKMNFQFKFNLNLQSKSERYVLALVEKGVISVSKIQSSFCLTQGQYSPIN